jgi:hypothetical protein
VTTSPSISRPIGEPQVDQILAIDDPVLRNRWITLAYCDLARESRRVIGGDNHTWCAFAVWASNEAGAMIRMEEIPELFKARLRAKRAGRESWMRGLVNTFEEAVDDLAAPVEGIAHIGARRVSTIIAQGNLQVFTDLGPAFACFVKDQRPKTTVPALVEAFEHYRSARSETDPQAKAQLALLGNLEAVHHEQSTLDTAVKDALDVGIHGVHSDKGRGPLHRFDDHIVEQIQEVWHDVMTERMMTLRTPSDTLFLGRDVPARKGRPLFPPAVATPELAELVAFFKTWDRTNGTGVGSAARDWCELSDRMNYITTFFRSRHQDPSLLAEPFSDEVLRAIGAQPPP